MSALAGSTGGWSAGQERGVNMQHRWIRAAQVRMMEAAAADDGMSTAEYAIGTIAAAAFGAILYTVVTGDNIVSALTGIVTKALNTTVG